MHTPAQQLNDVLTAVIPDLHRRSHKGQTHGKRVVFEKETVKKGNPDNLTWISFTGLNTMSRQRTYRLREWQEHLDYIATVLFKVTGVRVIPVWKPYIAMDLTTHIVQVVWR